MIKVEIVDTHLPGGVGLLTKTVTVFGIIVYNKKYTYQTYHA